MTFYQACQIIQEETQTGSAILGAISLRGKFNPHGLEERDSLLESTISTCLGNAFENCNIHDEMSSMSYDAVLKTVKNIEIFAHNAYEKLRYIKDCEVHKSARERMDAGQSNYREHDQLSREHEEKTRKRTQGKREGFS